MLFQESSEDSYPKNQPEDRLLVPGLLGRPPTCGRRRLPLALSSFFTRSSDPGGGPLETCLESGANKMLRRSGADGTATGINRINRINAVPVLFILCILLRMFGP